MMSNPVRRKVCPASRPTTPPAKSVVMAAVVVSAIPMTANQMPYHRRRGAIHCAPVSVISGVIDRAMKKQNSPAVPSTAASSMVRTPLAFSDSQAGVMKMNGTNTGRRMRNSAIERFLIVIAENSRYWLDLASA